MKPCEVDEYVSLEFLPHIEFVHLQQRFAQKLMKLEAATSQVPVTGSCPAQA